MMSIASFRSAIFDAHRHRAGRGRDLVGDDDVHLRLPREGAQDEADFVALKFV